MKLNDNGKAVMLALALLIAAVIGLGWVLTAMGCTTTRHLKSAQADSTVVAKTDSGHVHTDNSTSKTENDWWRETLLFQQRGKDTIERVLQPIYTNTTTPVAIIREGGKQTSEVKNDTRDSGWKEKYDSLQHATQEQSKDSKTTVLSFWQIIGLCIGSGLVFTLLGKLTIKWK